MPLSWLNFRLPIALSFCSSLARCSSNDTSSPIGHNVLAFLANVSCSRLVSSYSCWFFLSNLSELVLWILHFILLSGLFLSDSIHFFLPLISVPYSKTIKFISGSYLLLWRKSFFSCHSQINRGCILTFSFGVLGYLWLIQEYLQLFHYYEPCKILLMN